MPMPHASRISKNPEDKTLAESICAATDVNMARATKDSSERRVKLENVLKRAASGQTLSDKTPANSRRLPVVLV